MNEAIWASKWPGRKRGGCICRVNPHPVFGNCFKFAIRTGSAVFLAFTVAGFPLQTCANFQGYFSKRREKHNWHVIAKWLRFHWVMSCIKNKTKHRYPVTLGRAKSMSVDFFFLHFGRFILTATTALAVVIANRRQCRRFMGARMEFKPLIRGSSCTWVGLLGEKP